MALFWPSAATDRARHSLRQSVYVLRRALGPDVVLSRGDEELGLASERLIIDVATFAARLAAGEPEAAMALYAGDFLPGFYVPDAPDFEYWLHAERSRLRDRAAAAALEIAGARELAGDPEAVGAWARRAAELAPFDESLQRDAISLLARTGDRIAAMQLYDRFVERLRDEYEMEPDTVTRDLADTIRSGSEE